MAARLEISSWLQSRGENSSGVEHRLEIDSIREDQRTVLFKAEGLSFTLQWQQDYPKSESYLFVDTESNVGYFRAIISDLRDFIYDHPTDLAIDVVLNKMVQMLAKKARARSQPAVAGPLSPKHGHVQPVPATDAPPGDSGSGSPVRMGSGSDAGSDGDWGEEDGGQEDYEYEYDDEDGEDSSQTAARVEWEREHEKKKRWAAREVVLRQHMARATAAEQQGQTQKDLAKVTAGVTLADRGTAKSTTPVCTPASEVTGADKVNQIFTSAASSSVLTADLLAIQRQEAAMGLNVEAVDDNIYHWRVKMSNFDPKSELAQDIAALRGRFGYGYVELELTFTIDLYPFYPPLVKLVRPRFQGYMMSRIASMEVVQLSSWRPVQGMLFTLQGLQRGLQSWARVEADSPLNDIALHPEGSYTELEHLLMRLGLITELAPRSTLKWREEDIVSAPGTDPWDAGGEKLSVGERKRKREATPIPAAMALPVSKPTAEASEPVAPSLPVFAFAAPAAPAEPSAPGAAAKVKKEYWAKGTGYGHGQGSTWNLEEYNAALRQKDRLLAGLLQRIRDFLLPPQDQCPPWLWEAAEASKTVSVEDDGSQPPSPCKQANRIQVLQESYLTLDQSCLLPALGGWLGNDSLRDIERHSLLYHTVIQVVGCLLSWPHLAPMLLPVEWDPSKAISQHLEDLRRIIQIYCSTQAKAEAVAAQAAASAPPTTPTVPGAAKSTAAPPRPATVPALTADEGGPRLMVMLQNLMAQADTVLGSTQPPSSPPVPAGFIAGRLASRRAASTKASSTPQNEAEQLRQYEEVMRPMQYRDVPKFPSYQYSGLLAQNTYAARNRPRTRRLAQEHADLSHSLPLSLSSSVWVRAHEQSMDSMQVLISGPEDTPYSSGLFLFDVFFPGNYPEGPPQVHLQTTGQGSVRFNPNLYNCGKVCLSLLGTWEGKAGETWDAQTSTMLQVLVSIQSLILVPQPFFNEPGFEKHMGTPTGDQHNKNYNDKTRKSTVQWAMLDMLRHPPEPFKDVVRAHFFLRRDFILKQLDQWCAEAPGGLLGRGKGTIWEAASEVKRLVNDITSAV